MNYIKQIVIGFVLIAVMVVAVRIQITINEANMKKQELAEQRDELKYQNEKLQRELDMPLDDDYVARVASDQLGYKDPNAKYFYNNLPD